MKKKKLTYGQKPRFSVPKNYFEELENRIMQSVASENEEPRKILPQKQEVFAVPEGYFEKLELEVLQKTLNGKKEEVKVIPLHKRRTFYMAAASIAALFVLFFSIFNFEKTNETASFNDVELSSMESYIEEGYIDFSTTDVSSFVEGGDYATETGLLNVDNEELMEYFDEHVDNPGLLIE